MVIAKELIEKEKVEESKERATNLKYMISILLFGVSIFLFITVFIIQFHFDILNEVGINKILDDKVIFLEQEIIDDCSGLDLFDTSDCLRSKIKPFFNYTPTDDNISLNFTELKERGGDCRDWSFLYQRLGAKLNFSSSTIRVGSIYGVVEGHRFAVLWDDTHYCELDMIKDVKCYEIKV